MPTSFLSSEEYDERAHQHYNDGDYEGALEILQEGLSLYPHSVELYVGLGYAHLAREEFIWAKQALDKALVLDPENEDALVGVGEVLLRFGRRAEAQEIFHRVCDEAIADDLELLLSIGRALFREELFEEAREVFALAVELRADSPEGLSGLAFTLHRLDDEPTARKMLRRALRVAPEYHEARVFLGHLLYDRGHWVGALREFERVPAEHHWESVALWRLLELKRTLFGIQPGDPRLVGWEQRLEQLDSELDPVDEVLAEVEAAVLARDVEREAEESGAEVGSRSDHRGPHRVRASADDGVVLVGTWAEIVEQLRERSGEPDETVADFMRRWSRELAARTGAGVPEDDPEGFLLAHAAAGLLHIEC